MYNFPLPVIVFPTFFWSPYWSHLSLISLPSPPQCLSLYLYQSACFVPGVTVFSALKFSAILPLFPQAHNWPLCKIQSLKVNICGWKLKQLNIRLIRAHPTVMSKVITAHGAWHSHVPQAFTSHHHTGDEVRGGCLCNQNGWDDDFLTHLNV